MKVSTTNLAPLHTLTSEILFQDFLYRHNNGFFRGSEGVDFDANLVISSIDFGTFHVRPALWFL
jgi:hypothetical protein